LRAARRRHGTRPPKPVPSRSRFIFFCYLPTTTGLRYSPAKIYPAILPASGKIVCWRGTGPRAGACQRRVPGWKAVPGVNARSGDRRVDLAAITQAASRETGGVPAGLLGGYLPAARGAASSARRWAAADLAEYARSGERAAESGVALRGLVDLYLSATWRLWRELPGDTGSPAALRAAGLAVLRAADDAVAAAAGGFERAYLSVGPPDEAGRREVCAA